MHSFRKSNRILFKSLIPLSISALTTHHAIRCDVNSSTASGSTRSSSSSHIIPSRIGYCSDIEGNLAYFEKYVSISKVLYRDDHGVLQLRNGCYYVFGGDICDRGDGDLRVMKELVSLKKRYPERVHFVIGNRDINKLRLYFELHPTVINKGPPDTYWYHKWVKLGKAEAPPLLDNFTERMKWTTLRTMGMPHSFEYR